jgi:DNA-binding transcriptional MerR regulator
MAATDSVPIFNVKAVVQQTGVKADRLRVWERRYGLPAPMRNPAGRRLYSRRDVETIRWLAARQAEGLNISQAVALWRRIEAEGRDPLDVAPLAPPLRPAADSGLSDLREAWIQACQAFHEPRAEETLSRAFSLYPPETVCLEVLLRGLAEIGSLWYAGKVTVHQEHFASALAMRRVEALLTGLPSPSRPGCILVACPPQEAHSFNLLLLSYLLRRHGWEVVYLGADVPLQQWDRTIQAAQPQWVVTAAQYLPAAASLLGLGQAVRDLGVPMAFGGRVFNLVPSLRRRIPGHFLSERLEDAVERMEGLMAAPLPVPQPEPPDESYRQALARFREREVVIRAEVWLALAQEGRAEEWLIPVGREFGRHMEAALALGEVALLETYLDWLRDLRGEGALPPGWLSRYLALYVQALRRWLDRAGGMVAGWLEAYRKGEV